MNKILSIAAIVALFTTLSFAQEGGLKFGIRAGFNLYDLSSGIKEMDKELDLGMGFGGGIAVNIPLSGSFLSLNPELNFYYRKLLSLSYSDSWNDGGYSYSESGDVYINEFALSVPVMLQIAPIDAFYLAAGVQLDMPFSTKGHYEYEAKENGESYSESGSEKIKNRVAIDFGIALGLGYNITQNFRADLRCVIGLTSTGIFTGYDEEYVDGERREIKVKDTKSSFNQYGLGLTYFF